MILMLLGLAIGTFILYISHFLSCRRFFRTRFFVELPHPLWCLLPCCWSVQCCMTVRNDEGRCRDGNRGGGDGGGGDGGGGDGGGGG
jgi:uncharacterized membrane protein YgcG